MPRKRSISLLEALRLSIDEAERQKLDRAVRQKADRVERALARYLGQDPNYCGPGTKPRKPRAIPAKAQATPTPPPLRFGTAEREDREHGLELYCEQLLRILLHLPRNAFAHTRTVELPADQVDQICRQLNYLLRLRDPKPALAKAA